jgi:hypothetical protein
VWSSKQANEEAAVSNIESRSVVCFGPAGLAVSLVLTQFTSLLEEAGILDADYEFSP